MESSTEDDGTKSTTSGDAHTHKVRNHFVRRKSQPSSKCFRCPPNYFFFFFSVILFVSSNKRPAVVYSRVTLAKRLQGQGWIAKGSQSPLPRGGRRTQAAPIRFFQPEPPPQGEDAGLKLDQSDSFSLD